ncbi:MAG: hypothetical protein JWM58_4285 [Rhizobium sp.]|nr:hypothetical protein [Rhizobium sp.]
MDDPYLDETGTLKNRFDVQDQSELAAVEARLAAARELQILDNPPQGRFDLPKLQKIHAALFGDVYTWAGHLRITTLAKRAYEGSDDGITTFTAPVHIRGELLGLLGSLPKDDVLAKLSGTEFSRHLAPLFVGLNNIHPFREGNGRTQRLFFTLLAQTYGHTLSWDVVTRERMVDVSISGARGDEVPMVRLFSEISDRRRVEALRNAIRYLQSSNQVPWNDLYIATTTAGQTYSGRFVGSAGTDFMMRVHGNEKTWIAIGDSQDISGDLTSGDNIEIKPKHW